MVRICAGCHWLVGFKAPWLDLRITHSLCGRCYRRLLAQYQYRGFGLGS